MVTGGAAETSPAVSTSSLDTAQLRLRLHEPALLFRVEASQFSNRAATAARRVEPSPRGPRTRLEVFNESVPLGVRAALRRARRLRVCAHGPARHVGLGHGP